MKERQHFRLTQQVSIYIDFFEKKGEQYQPTVLICSSLDVSSGGLKLEIDRALKPQAIYQIGLQIEGLLFNLAIQVRWQESSETNTYFVGAEILDSDGTDVVAFKRWVADRLQNEING